MGCDRLGRRGSSPGGSAVDANCGRSKQRWSNEHAPSYDTNFAHDKEQALSLTARKNSTRNNDIVAGWWHYIITYACTVCSLQCILWRKDMFAAGALRVNSQLEQNWDFDSYHTWMCGRFPREHS